MKTEQSPDDIIKILDSDCILEARIAEYLDSYVLSGFTPDGDLIMLTSRDMTYQKRLALIESLTDLKEFLNNGEESIYED